MVPATLFGGHHFLSLRRYLPDGLRTTLTDYQSIEIKNTGSELEGQDERMRHVLVEASKRFGLVVVGYSGRDASVMEALESVLKDPNPYPSGLYWVTSSASKLLPAVQQFLEHATLAGVDVAIVEAKTFDELAAVSATT